MFDLIWKSAAGLLAMSLLTSCGSKMQTRNGVSLASASSDNNGAECNSFTSQGVGLAGAVSTFYLGGRLQESQIRLHITNIDSSFDSSSNYLQFYKWRADSNGGTSIDSTPLTFFITRLRDGAAISSGITSLRASDVNQYRATGGLSGTTTQDFFANTAFVLTGLDYSWQATKIVLYNGVTSISDVDMLVPIFTANPQSYASTHAPVLAALHPFYNLSNQNLSDADWVNKSKTFCF